MFSFNVQTQSRGTEEICFDRRTIADLNLQKRVIECRNQRLMRTNHRTLQNKTASVLIRFIAEKE